MMYRPMSTPTVHPTDNRTVKSYLGQNQYVTCNLILISVTHGRARPRQVVSGVFIVLIMSPRVSRLMLLQFQNGLATPGSTTGGLS